MENITGNHTGMLEQTAENSAEWYATVILGITIALVTVAANLSAIVDILKKRKLLPFHYYLLNLTAVDLLTGLFAQPNMILYNYYGNWPLGESWCSFWIIFDVCVNAVSFVTLVVISGDRLFAVAYPIRYLKSSTKNTAMVVIVASWAVVVIPFLVNFIQIRIMIRHPEPDCRFIDYDFVTGAGLVSTIIAIYLPPLLITFNYILLCALMVKRLAKKRVIASSFSNNLLSAHTETIEMRSVSVAQSTTHSGQVELPRPKRATVQQKQKSDRDRKPFVLLGYLIFSFYVTCVPMAIYTLMWTADPHLPDTAPTSFLAVYWLQYLNSTLNPFLYALAEKNIMIGFLNACKQMITGRQVLQNGNWKAAVSTARSPTSS